jgi:division protein CdvB (Snf7/Vps24/ESCRT-III family)|tara:strand:- start:541 stop:1215 length:675 start_codon:yes stop_codon:yes gene_type:complete
MANFKNKWSTPAKQSLMQRIGDTVKPKGALKPRVETATNRVHTQVLKLDTMLSKLKTRDNEIFQQVITATQQHDTSGSKVLASELVELRKVTKILGNARMGLEQIELRLTTFHDLGDTVVAIMPTVGLMNGLKGSMSKFMPGADEELGRMNEMLSGLMADSFAGSNSTFSIDETTNNESEKILQEASAVAEQQTSERLPPMPEQPVSTTQPSSTNSVSDFFNNF